MIRLTIPYSGHSGHTLKAQLVDLALACLVRREWAMVSAITTIIWARGWRHV
jgi:hypothetical protein